MRIFSVKLLRALLLVSILTFSVAADQTKPGCRRSCGNLTDIPYPFGIISQADDSCNFVVRGSLFNINCSGTDQQGNPVPYWSSPDSKIIVKDISLEKHEMTVFIPMARDCYNTSGRADGYSPSTRTGTFPISTTKNKFTAVGCDTNAIFSGFQGSRYSMGCMSLCNSINDVTNGSCSGIGCCQTSIPRNVMAYNLSLSSYYSHSSILGFNPCSYSFVAENDYFNFSTQSLLNIPENEKAPLVLDWSIGSQTCEEAQKNMTSYMCMADNSYCSDATNGKGYRCYCSNGYQGNPYLLNGCQNINECTPTLNPCTYPMSCTDLPGTVTCSCPSGFEGNGWKIIDGNVWKNATGCSRIDKKTNYTARDVGLGVGLGFLFLLLCAALTVLGFRQRKVTKEREKFFHENGGLVLQKLLTEHGNAVELMKVFSAEELQKATNNYHESRILGQGGQGTVYKGILTNNTTVAVKKAKLLDRSQVDEFINEVIVLSQINHKNVVKLIGCCLETEYPLLVYEFVTNGTLFDHIHKNPNNSTLSTWRDRLRVAAEAAGALSYLHTDTTIQIVHRDVKSSNILLDENYTTKVSDFGASRLMPADQDQLNTLVQGTLGYLDPEYFQSSQLTEKSDVYSFGVVIAELLTGIKALSFERPEKERTLALFFVSAVKAGRLLDIIDQRILKDGSSEHIDEVAILASRCLKIHGDDRPTMKEVALELEGLFRMVESHPHPQVHQHNDSGLQETEYLLREIVDNYSDEVSQITTASYDTMRNQVTFHIEGGR